MTLEDAEVGFRLCLDRHRLVLGSERFVNPDAADLEGVAVAEPARRRGAQLVLVAELGVVEGEVDAQSTRLGIRIAAATELIGGPELQLVLSLHLVEGLL